MVAGELGVGDIITLEAKNIAGGPVAPLHPMHALEAADFEIEAHGLPLRLSHQGKDRTFGQEQSSSVVRHVL